MKTENMKNREEEIIKNEGEKWHDTVKTTSFLVK